MAGRKASRRRSSAGSKAPQRGEDGPGQAAGAPTAAKDVDPGAPKNARRSGGGSAGRGDSLNDDDARKGSGSEEELGDEDEEDIDWDDMMWRSKMLDELRSLRADVKNLRAANANLRKTLQDKREAEAEAKRMRQRAEDLEVVRESLAEAKDRVTELRAETADAKAVAAEQLAARRAAEKELDAERLRAQKLAAALSKAESDVEQSKRIYVGQEKAKDKLQNKIHQLERVVEQHKEAVRAADARSAQEARDIRRERELRLLDAHKIKKAENERDDLLVVAEERAQAAELAIRNESHMKGLLEPLRASIRRFEKLADEDAAELARVAEERAELALANSRLQDQLKAKSEHIQLLTTRVERMCATVTAVQADVYRLLQAKPESVEFLHSSEWGPLVAQLRQKAEQTLQRQARKAQARLPVVPSEQLLCKVFASRHHLHGARDDDDLLEDEPVAKFAALLEQCASQLKVPAARPASRGGPAGAALSRSRVDSASPASPTSRRAAPARLASLESHGSRYVGHGLGLRKPTPGVSDCVEHESANMNSLCPGPNVGDAQLE